MIQSKVLHTAERSSKNLPDYARGKALLSSAKVGIPISILQTQKPGSRLQSRVKAEGA